MNTHERQEEFLCKLLILAALLCVATAWFSGPAGRLFVALPLLLLGPGYLVEQYLNPLPQATRLARAALWPALSLSVVALIYQWATAIGLALPAILLEALALLCAAAIGWRIWQQSDPPLYQNFFRWPHLLMALVVAGTGWTRYTQTRDLALPPWVDSLHHALLIRVVAERGQAPYSLQPYLPVEHLSYHWGYHAFQATLLQIAGLAIPGDLPWTMLWTGQFIGTLQVLVWGAVAVYLWGKSSAGITTALVVGLFSIMPAYYLSWGRYTLLTGMLMLPAALIVLRELLMMRDRAAPGGRLSSPVGIGICAAIIMAGLSLVHFVVFIFALAWSITLWLMIGDRVALKRLALAGILALLLTGPWLMIIASQARSGTGSSATYVAGNASYNAMPMELLWSSNNRMLLALAGGAALLTLRRRQAASYLLIWALLVLLAANLPLIGLPYLSFITNELVAISLFVPASLLIGAGVATLDTRLHTIISGKISSCNYTIARAGGLAGIALWGVLNFQTVVRADTIIAGADDLAAIEWAAGATPPHARFVVNTVGWLYDVDRGADGGWWLLPLAGRQVSTPPVVYNYGSEPQVAMIKRTTAWLRETHTPEELAMFMRREGFDYVYATTDGPSFDREQLRTSALFEELYHNERVSLLRLVQPVQSSQLSRMFTL